MCKQLSDMLRYTVNSNAHSTKLREEVTCIANYLSLQKKYYEDFLEYEIHIPGDIEELDVPRLSILPFVENAMQHAFDGKRPPYRIVVEARTGEDFWMIRIRDNGRGFTDEKIEELKERIRSKNTAIDSERKKDGPGMGGMGIPNCILRLRLYLGENFYFRIENLESGEGAQVCLGYTGRWKDV